MRVDRPKWKEMHFKNASKENSSTIKILFSVCHIQYYEYTFTFEMFTTELHPIKMSKEL